jgi:hypothetical protein
MLVSTEEQLGEFSGPGTFCGWYCDLSRAWGLRLGNGWSAIRNRVKAQHGAFPGAKPEARTSMNDVCPLTFCGD